MECRMIITKKDPDEEDAKGYEQEKNLELATRVEGRRRQSGRAKARQQRKVLAEMNSSSNLKLYIADSLTEIARLFSS